MNDVQYAGLPPHKKRIVDILTKFKANPPDKHLPHPQRMKQNNFMSTTPQGFFGTRYAEGLRILENPQILPEPLLEQLYAQHLLNNYVIPDSTEATEYLIMMARHALFAMRHDVLQGKFFQIRDSLDMRLQATDLNKGCPCRYLRAPFASAYIKFNESDRAAPLLQDVEGNVCKLEGAYVLDVTYHNEMKETLCQSYPQIEKYVDLSKLKRILHLTFTTYPSLENMPDLGALFGRALFIEDEDEDIDSVLNKTESLIDIAMQGEPSSHAEFNNSVRHLVKVLLYLNSNDARLEYDNQVANLHAKITRVKCKKQAKLARQLKKAYDSIIVGPKHYDNEPAASHLLHGEGNKPHWRRGHYRVLPAHFPKRPENTLIWIKPTLIRADKVGIGAVQPKAYAVN